MTPISDEALGRLRQVVDEPDFSGTRYRIERELGRGGMGVVWAATDVELGREVAVKVLPLHEDSPEAEQRLAHEARILSRLEHPGIVPVHDLGRLPDGRAFYTMKLVRGERLDAALGRPEMPMGERLRLFERICEPVAFAHAHGIVHRDLKPSNIMIGPFGEVLVLDWGVAAIERDDARPQSAAVVGTRGYMAPEQERGEGGIDPRADVYALGAILKEICAGGPDPHDGMPKASMPKPLLAVIARATSVDPAGRYADAGALAAEISRWLDGQPVQAYRESRPERALRWLRRHRTLVALVAAYLLMRVIVALLFQR